MGPLRPWQFEDGEGEVEVRLKLPPGMGKAEAAKALKVVAAEKNLEVVFKDGEHPPLMEPTELYEKVRPTELAWYCEGDELVVSLPKAHKGKWPALTDEEALEKRFGPIRTSSMSARGAKKGAAGGAGGGGENPGARDGGWTGSVEKQDGSVAHAWAARARVEALLRAAQQGDVAGLKQAAEDLVQVEEDEEREKEKKGEEGPGGAAAGSGTGESPLVAVPDHLLGGDQGAARDQGGEAAEPGSSSHKTQPLPHDTAALRQAIEAVRDGNGRTALHFAASTGQLAACQYLVGDLGIPVDERDDEGETPLMLAARDDHAQTVQYFLDHGANPCAAAEKSGAQAVHYAAGHGSLGVLKVLLGLKRPGQDTPWVDVNASSEAGPPLLWACGHGKVGAVELLLANKADPNLQSEDGISPLLTAAAAGEDKIVELLTKSGAEVNEESVRGATPLFIAATEGHVGMLKCLLEAGADPNRTDEDGSTPVQVAGSLGLRDVVQCLLPLTRRPASVPEAEWTEDALVRPSSGAATPRGTDPGQGAAPGVDKGAAGEGHTDGGAGEADAPGDVVAAKQRAEDLFKAGKYMDAVDAYTQAIDLMPKSLLPSPSAPPLPAGPRPGSMADVAGALYSNRSLCWVRLGQPHANQGMFEQALSDARAARSLRPTWGKACYREGVALQLLGRYEDAASAFFEGVQLDPKNTDIAKAFQEAVKLGREAHAKSRQEEQRQQQAPDAATTS